MTGISHKEFVSGGFAGVDEPAGGPHPVDRHVGLHIRMRRGGHAVSPVLPVAAPSPPPVPVKSGETTVPDKPARILHEIKPWR